MQINFVKSRISGFLNYGETKTLLSYNPNFDFRTPLQYITERNKEIDIILNLRPPRYFYISNLPKGLILNNGEFLFPLSKISNQRTLWCNEYGNWEEYITDKYGFNNKNIIYKKEIDFMLMGDSYIEGECVGNENTIPYHLSKLSQKNVLNIGIGGAGPLTLFAQLREYLKHFNPKVVLWFQNSYDIINFSEREIINETFMKYFENNEFNQNLFHRQKLIDKELRKFLLQEIQKQKKFNLQDLLLLRNLRNFLKILIKKVESEYINKDNNNTIFYNNETTLKMYSQLIDKILRETEKYNKEIIFILYPNTNNIFSSKEKYMQSKILGIWRKHKLNYIDTRKYFKNMKFDEIFVYGRGHFTKKAYKIFSENLYRDLSDKFISN